MQKAAFAVTLAALALLGVVLAYWSWAWFAPPAAPRAPAAVQGAGRTASAAGLFGVAQNGSSAAATGSGALLLMGVVAASGGREGHAVLRLDGKRSVAVLEGGEIAPGLRLAEVHVNHIVVLRNGARETLALPEKGGK
ncbi:MAG TPA: type II secretion system protein N [Burkholderiales bacterium]